MKRFFTLLILISNLALYSQADNAAGDYLLSAKTKESDMHEWKLTLNENGTFFFHYYSSVKLEIPSQKNYYGKGKWSIKDNLISFIADKQNDIDDKYTLDFTNSKARFISKSPRNKTNQVIETRIKFIATEIFWMKGTELLKI